MTDQPATTPADDREAAAAWAEVQRLNDLASTLAKHNGDLITERDEARALAVKAQTDADDLRARVTALAERIHDLPFEWAGSVHPSDVADWLRAALEGET